jgi:hypothetical protein
MPAGVNACSRAFSFRSAASCRSSAAICWLGGAAAGAAPADREHDAEADGEELLHFCPPSSGSVS